MYVPCWPDIFERTGENKSWTSNFSLSSHKENLEIAEWIKKPEKESEC